jgi:hypothetical protein
MGILNKSEAETFQQFLNGERLWSWPNGRLQLGQTFPDLTIINQLVRKGLLDQDYQPTDAGRSALLSWLAAGNLSHSVLPASDQPSR